MGGCAQNMAESDRCRIFLCHSIQEMNFSAKILVQELEKDKSRKYLSPLSLSLSLSLSCLVHTFIETTRPNCASLSLSLFPLPLGCRTTIPPAFLALITDSGRRGGRGN